MYYENMCSISCFSHCIILTIALFSIVYPSSCSDKFDFKPEQLITEEEYSAFMSRKDKRAIVLRYPSMLLFSTSIITDYARIVNLLGNNDKCVFGVYETQIGLSGDVSSLEPHLVYSKDDKEVLYEGLINTSYILSWITLEDLCDLRISDKDRLLMYRRTLVPGHMQMYALFTEETFTEKRFNNLYEVLRETNIHVPCFYIKEKSLTDYILDRTGYDLIVTKFPTIMIIRDIPHMRQYRFFYKSMDKREDLEEFYRKDLVPIIHGTNSYMLPDIFKMDKIIIYIYTKGEELKDYIRERWITEEPVKHHDKFIFLHSKGSEIVESKLNTLLFIDQDYVDCAVRAFEFHINNLQFKKYRPNSIDDGEITIDGMNQFISDLREGKLRHYIKSELAIPENIDTGAVKTLVGEDFHRRVIESDNDWLIVFYSPWCGHCHISKRVFRDIGRRLKGFDALSVATFDAYNNEVEDIEITAYPTIAMFPSGAKNEPVYFNKEINLQNIAQFIEEEARKEHISASAILNRNIEHEPIFELHTEL